jgi:hypothetical protein
MSVGSSSTPEHLEEQAGVAREQVDRTLEALERRFSVKRRPVGAAAGAPQTFKNAVSAASKAVCPSITTVIRFDHAHVLAAFRRYRTYLPGPRKRAMVANISLALEIHAQLEEEIFYPALFAAGWSTDDLDKGINEHDQMQVLINALRELSPSEAAFDQTFHELIRLVLHHIADEETTLLPFAEVHLREHLQKLGWQMSVRRLELLKTHKARAVITTAVTFPVLSGALMLGTLYAGWRVLKVITRSRNEQRHRRRPS